MSFDVLSAFKKLGAEMLISEDEFQKKVESVKAFVFDWDGVFHSGRKDKKGGSSFSEIDSMGINMLRFGYYLKDNRLPPTFIATGEENKTGQVFATREHLNGIFFKTKNKIDILPFLKNTHNLEPYEVAFFFDDILDISLAEKAGLRLMIGNTATPFLTNYCKQNNIVDYITAHGASYNAIRECSELLLHTIRKNEEVMEERKSFSDVYKFFLSLRNKVNTQKVAIG